MNVDTRGTDYMLRERITVFGEPERDLHSLARNLIEASAWWQDHPQSTTSAPGWADQIVDGPHGLEIQFGANYFLVEQAILLSQRAILDERDHSQTLNTPIDRKLLYGRLITCVRKSVANWNHEPYDYYPGGSSPELRSQGYYIGSGRFPTLRDTSRYGSTPPSKDVWKGLMKFGVHSIKVDAFVERILQLAGLKTVK